MRNIYMVVPAYNEEDSLGKVLTKLKKKYAHIIVVDDGSIDKTYAIAKRHQVICLRHIINRGQGAALKTGIDAALLHGAHVIVTFDADGQFLVEDIKRVVQPVIDGSVDVVLGSRFLGRSPNIPFLKKMVLRLGVLVVRILYDIKVTDSQNGFRAFSRAAAEKICITSSRMEHAGEIMGEIISKGLTYKEVPVTVRYTSYSLARGQSWKKSIHLGLRMLFKKIFR